MKKAVWLGTLLLAVSAFGAPIVYVGQDVSGVGIYGKDYRYLINPFHTSPGANWYTSAFDHS